MYRMLQTLRRISQQSYYFGFKTRHMNKIYYHENVIEHYNNPRNIGSLDKKKNEYECCGNGCVNCVLNKNGHTKN